jgi:lycopene beta-cyclase
VQVDVAVVGAGGAGGSVLVQLARRLVPGREPPTVAVVDPELKSGRDRTWSFWDEGASAVDQAVHRSWQAVLLVEGAGTSTGSISRPMRYAMVRSQDFYALADAAPQRLGVQRVLAPRTRSRRVTSSHRDGPTPARSGPLGARLRARRHRAAEPCTSCCSTSAVGRSASRGRRRPTAPVLHGLLGVAAAHGRRLRLRAARGRAHRSRRVHRVQPFARLSDAAYEKALAGYLDARYGGAGGYEVTEIEDGAIP